MKMEMMMKVILILTLMIYSCSGGGLINNCPSSGAISSSTRYLQNLKTLLTKMTSESSKTGFYEHSVGSGSDRVYGSYLCQGRLPAANCSECIAEASSGLKTACLDKVEASAWYDECILKYSNKNFFGDVDHDDAITWCSSSVTFNTTSPKLEKVLYNTLTKVAKEAAESRTKFATMEADLKFLHENPSTLFTSAQCVPDISGDSCLQCLNQSITSDLPTFCSRTVGGRTVSSSCIIRYDVNQFYVSEGQ